MSPQGLFETLLDSDNKLFNYNWDKVTHIVFSGLAINRYGRVVISSNKESFSYLKNGDIFVKWFQSLKQRYPHLQVYWAVDARREDYAQNFEFWINLTLVVAECKADGIYVKMNTRCEAFLDSCVVPLIIEPYTCDFETLTFFQKYTPILVINSFGFLSLGQFPDFDKESDLNSTIEMLQFLLPFLDYRKVVLGMTTEMLSFKNNGEQYCNLPINLLSNLLFGGRNVDGVKYKFERSDNRQIGSSTLTISSTDYYEKITFEDPKSRIKKFELVKRFGLAGIIVGDISKDFPASHIGSFSRLFGDFLAFEAQSPE